MVDSSDQKIYKASFRKDMGAACHQRSQAQYAVAAITDTFGNILFSNYESIDNKWLIKSARPTITRFWSACTLYVTCTLNRTDLSVPAPPLPEVLHAKTAPVEVKEDPLSVDAAEESSNDILDLADNVLEMFGESPAPEEGETASEETTDELPEGDYFTSPLDKGDEVMMYVGYINELRPVLSTDLEENRLLRVFIGSVDTISVTESEQGGTTLTIQCRDRMKYLMDSLVTYNSSEDFTEIIGLDDGEDSDSNNSATRSSVILQVARRSVGQITATNGDQPVCSQPTCGMKIDEGIVYDVEKMVEQGTFKGIKPNVFYEDNYQYTARWSERKKATYAQQKSGKPYEVVQRSKTFPSMEQLDEDDVSSRVNAPLAGDDGLGRRSIIEVDEESRPGLSSSVVNYPLPSYHPKFHIATGRAGFPDEKFGRNFSLVDRIPLEYIKYLASQEIYPTEVFQDSRSGDFYYTPRANDTSGLFDPERFFRTYYSRNVPEGHFPDKAQMLLSYREESSMINFRSNIIVSNVDSSSGGDQNSASIQVHLKVVPPWLKGKSFACTYYNFVDPTIKTMSEAAIIAVQVARLMSKETRAAVAVLLGDPSIVPGEIVQIIGSSLYPPGCDAETAKKEVEEFVAYNDLYNQTYEDYQQIIHDTSEGDVNSVEELPIAGADPITVANQADKDNAALMCGDNSSAMNLKADIRTMWRVEGVIHHFNEGKSVFTTELALISPF